MLRDHGIIHFYDPKNLDHEKWFTQNLVVVLIFDQKLGLLYISNTNQLFNYYLFDSLVYL